MVIEKSRDCDALQAIEKNDYRVQDKNLGRYE